MVTMREEEAARYNLGWLRIDVKRAATELCYVLVPADLDQITGSVPLKIRFRDWSQMELAPGEREALLRAGGVA